MEEITLASELLHELKMSAKRWFIAFCIMVGLELVTITGFMIYLSLPVEEVTEVTQSTDGTSNTLIGVGDNNYGE